MQVTVDGGGSGGVSVTVHISVTVVGGVSGQEAESGLHAEESERRVANTDTTLEKCPSMFGRLVLPEAGVSIGMVFAWLDYPQLSVRRDERGTGSNLLAWP